MFNVLNRTKSIKTKLLLQSGALILLSVILMLVTLYYFNKISSLNNAKFLIQELDISFLELRKAEKDFLIQDLTNQKFFETGQTDILKKHTELYDKTLDKLKQLSKHKVSKELALSTEIDNSIIQLQQYENIFTDLTLKYKQKGFKDFGFEGDLRSAVHSIEESSDNYDKIQMLTLRRHEKDYIIRKDPAYVEKFDKALSSFQSSLSDNKTLLDAATLYGVNFHKLVEIDKTIGLTLDEGIKKNLRETIHQIEPVLNSLESKISTKVESSHNSSYVMLLVFFIFQITIGFTIANIFAKKLTNSIHKIQERITKLSEGIFPEKIVPETIDEFGNTSLSLNNLIDRVKTAANFASKIGEGELNITYDENFSNDVLATSLQSMHTKLKEATEESNRRNWTTLGLANFGEIVRKSDTDVKKLSQELIGNLVKYLEANQGQLYILNDKTSSLDEHLELMATYAWNKIKFEHKTIFKGDGLVGQAWLEKQTILLKEIPKNYISITSGLGEALPNCILITPLKVNDEVFGVIEIATFKHFEPYQIEFVEKLAEVIASSISSVQINQKTKLLLEESRQQSEELRSQEEEMRQNAEEMHATQEELQRQKVLSDKRIKDLEAELAKLKNG